MHAFQYYITVCCLWPELIHLFEKTKTRPHLLHAHFFRHDDDAAITFDSCSQSQANT